jgi:ribosome-interacting GTPase 1
VENLKKHKLNFKYFPMSEKATRKPYDLENRTFEFTKHVRLFTKKPNHSPLNSEDAKQVL